MRFPTIVNRLHAVVILVVFTVFVLNAMGLMDIRLHVGGDIAINAQVLGHLLDARFGPAMNQPDFLVFIGVGTLLVIALPALRPIGASVVTLAAMLPPFFVAWKFPVPPAVVPLEYTLLSILVLFSINVLTRYYLETHRRRHIVAAFGQYVPPPVVEQLSRDPQAFSMAGEAREMSVLFCDIKHFSSISEQLDPAELAEMINHYLTAMTDVLHAHGATIDKYIGDAIMAFWGAPVAQPDHAARAVRAALDMHSRSLDLGDDFVQRGWPRLEFGIGINSGAMSVGNMGSRYRVAYTVLGDAVNLAARLEGLTRLYEVGILVSAATRAAVPDLRFREIDRVRVKGKGHAGRIFEPLRAGTGASDVLADECAALAAYYEGDWDTATARFEALKMSAPALSWYNVMLARMARHERPRDWEGIVTFSGELDYSLGTSRPEDSGA